MLRMKEVAAAEPTAEIRDLHALFHPRTIAVVGASARYGKWGSFLLAHLLSGGFQGEVYPINPHEKTIFGLPVHRSVREIPTPVDLAFITTPAASVPRVIEDCIHKGVGAVVVVSSGFAEVGEEGRKLEEEVVRLARRGGLPLVGPNTMGVVSTPVRLYATGAPVRPEPGPVSFISQSGNLGTQLLSWSERRGIGINKFVGSGNEGDLKTTDYLAYLLEDTETQVILLYLEGSGGGRRLIDTALRGSSRKPILVLKAGRTRAGQKAALSHTGALGGDRRVVEGALAQARMIQVDNPSELLNLAAAFAYLPLPSGPRVGVITLGGGWGVVTADACNEAGLELPPLSHRLVHRFDELLPPFWSRSNPVDLVGQFNAKMYHTVLEEMARDEGLDSIIVMGVIGLMDFILRSYAWTREVDGKLDEEEIQRAREGIARFEEGFLQHMASLIQETGKPIVGVSLSSQRLSQVKTLGDGSKIVTYSTPERAVQALSRLTAYARLVREERSGSETGTAF